ncbi:ragulator complex protein LAMTOR1-like [Vidua macroura]|uniref:ragulator complex protein LAMTOR1-like n=1 Tax=Vidua macroura TaxID=187451 RepID=UPI0023A824D3|nr:ragulator complex protein LAMTOR1-like [Vidua macroura]
MDLMLTPQFQLRWLKGQLAFERKKREEMEVEVVENHKLIMEKGQSLAGCPEKKRLLEPAASPPNKALNGAEQSYHNFPSAHTDEQAMLSSILAKTAINIIDVSAADSQGMEQHEYMDRARQYSTRLLDVPTSLTHWKKLPLPFLTNQLHQVLISEPVPFTDLQQVSRAAAYTFSALSQIRADTKEELVVQFGIP